VIARARSCDETNVSGTDSATRGSVLLEASLDSPAPREQEPTCVPERHSERVHLRELFQAQYASIWRLLRRFGVHPSLLDDAAQEVFWIAARRLADITPGKERAFLYGVALRVASNAARRQKVMPPLSEWSEVEALSDPQPSPEASLEQRQTRQVLDLVLDGMPAELRTVFVLFELEGLPVRDIAELEDIPLGTASSRLRRAREEFSTIAKRLRTTMLARGGKL
jgi:RNA polymerase sigma-70 factor (ECF subfamily)